MVMIWEFTITIVREITCFLCKSSWSSFWWFLPFSTSNNSVLSMALEFNKTPCSSLSNTLFEIISSCSVVSFSMLLQLMNHHLCHISISTAYIVTTVHIQLFSLPTCFDRVHPLSHQINVSAAYINFSYLVHFFLFNIFPRRAEQRRERKKFSFLFWLFLFFVCALHLKTVVKKKLHI